MCVYIFFFPKSLVVPTGLFFFIGKHDSGTRWKVKNRKKKPIIFAGIRLDRIQNPATVAFVSSTCPGPLERGGRQRRKTRSSPLVIRRPDCSSPSSRSIMRHRCSGVPGGPKNRRRDK